MGKTGIGIIGCGNIAKNAHAPSYHNNKQAEVLYFCDIVPERAREMVRKYGCGKAVTDYREVLQDPKVEAVSVCTPNNLHCKIATDALKAGKHVLCEKPAARTYAEALEMQRVQHETGKILNIGMVNRFNTAVNKVKELIESGALGEVYHVYGSFRSQRSIPGLGGAFTTRSISGGGVLIDWGVHFIDLILHCVGDPVPQTVSGQAYSRLGKKIRDYTYVDMWAGPPKLDGIYDVEDFITGLIRTDGPTISLNGAWAQNIGEEEMYVDFLGDKAGIRLKYLGNFKLYTARGGSLLEITPSFPSKPPFQNEIDSFLDCIQTGKKLPSHIDRFMRTQQIIQALYDSSDKRREISLPEAEK